MESNATLSAPFSSIAAEIETIDQQIAELYKRAAELRRAQPPVPVEDYVFIGWEGEKVRLSELFGDKSELIVIHNMGRKCSYCTLWADSFTGILKHLEDRAAFVLTSPDDAETQRKFARDRGWNFRMVSTKGNTFKADMGFEPEPRTYWPGVTVFRKSDDGSIEAVSKAGFGPGDPYCGLWHFLDLLPTETAWEPKIHYA